MNIGKMTIVKGLEKTGCSVGHIQQCLSDKNKHGQVAFSYFGKRVQKGMVDVYTKNGVFSVYFDCLQGWARKIKIL